MLRPELGKSGSRDREASAFSRKIFAADGLSRQMKDSAFRNCLRAEGVNFTVGFAVTEVHPQEFHLLLP